MMQRRLYWELQFRNGAVYQYFHVPRNVYRDLLSAPSKGSYFNHNIRGRYPYRLIQDAAGTARPNTSANLIPFLILALPNAFLFGDAKRPHPSRFQPPTSATV
jgi:KTSC domain